EGHPLDERPGGVPGHPRPERDRPEALVLYHAGEGPATGGGAGGTGGAPPDPPRQRPVAPDRLDAPRGALLPALRGVPERLPGVPPDRRPRLRLHVPRPDRDPPDRDAQGQRLGPRAGPRLLALRRVQGRLPGAHRHPADARRAARAPRPREDRAVDGADGVPGISAPAPVAGRVPALRARRATAA